MTTVEFIQGFHKVNKTAIVYQEEHFSYEWLLNQIALYQQTLSLKQVPVQSVVQVNADFSPYSIALLCALVSHQCIVVPMTNIVLTKQKEYQDIASINAVIDFDGALLDIKFLKTETHHEILKNLRDSKTPGLIIMSSGSTGKSKAIVHDFNKLLSPFSEKKRGLTTIAFLLFDHIGGLNTLLNTLHNGGTLVIPASRDIEPVCRAIQAEKVEALITSPSFLNLMLLSRIYEKYDMNSLRIINYGSEPMPESLLHRLNTVFPDIRLSQAYGLSELGVLKVKSKSSDSLLIKIDEGNSETRINDGMLEIKSTTSMLGYLNAPSPYTEDGWFKTGDMVLEENDYIRVLGRKSDIINVGGEKVYPAEIENVLLSIVGVEDAVVIGEASTILGNLVKARIKCALGTDENKLRLEIKQFCRQKLPAFKIPQKIEFVHDNFHGERFKKMRKVN
jgi:long-chain acyl-CoA synthetase